MQRFHRTSPGVRSLQRLQSVTLADFIGPVIAAGVVGLIRVVLLMTVYKAAIVVLTSFVKAILVRGGFTITLDGGHVALLFLGPLVS